MIGKKVKAGDVVGVLHAIVGNAAFIEVEPNVHKAVHLDSVVEVGDAEEAPVAAPAAVAEPEVPVEAPKPKARKKKAPKAPE